MNANGKLQLMFAITALLGCVIVFNALVLWPTLPLFVVDAVLTPEELKDPKLREVAERTADHRTTLHPSTIYAVLGGLVLITSAIGMVAVNGYRKCETRLSDLTT